MILLLRNVISILSAMFFCIKLRCLLIVKKLETSTEKPFSEKTVFVSSKSICHIFRAENKPAVTDRLVFQPPLNVTFSVSER